MLGCGAATATNDIHQPLFDKRTHLLAHHLRRLVILTHCIRQTGIGIRADIAIGMSRQDAQVGQHITGTERAIEANAQNRSMRDRDKKSLDGLPRQYASRFVADSHAEHQGHPAPHPAHCFLGGIDTGLGVQGVENGFQKNGIYSSLDERRHLLSIGIGQLIKRNSAHCGIVDIGTDGAGFACGPDRTKHETGFLGSGVPVCHLACQSHSRMIDVLHQMFATVVSKRYALCVEGTSGYEVGTCLQVLLMDVLNEVRFGKAKQIAKSLTPRQHRAHRAVKVKNPLI